MRLVLTSDGLRLSGAWHTAQSTTTLPRFLTVGVLTVGVLTTGVLTVGVLTVGVLTAWRMIRAALATSMGGLFAAE